MKRSLLPLDVGTPKSLDEAVMHALCIGPLSEVQERTYHVMRDFLSQKFSIAYLKLEANPEALQIVEQLFAACTERPAKNSVLIEASVPCKLNHLGETHGEETEGDAQKEGVQSQSKETEALGAVVVEPQNQR